MTGHVQIPRTSHGLTLHAMYHATMNIAFNQPTLLPLNYAGSVKA